MTIKIDVDGVIRNMFDDMCDVYNKEFGDNVNVDDIVDYDVDKSFPKVMEMLGIPASKYFFEDNSRRLFLLSSAYDGAKGAIDRLRGEGHKVAIVSWQFSLDNRINTLRFLSNNGIDYDTICFTKDKWMVDGDWLIDDNPEFITDERDRSEKIMINMPYNRSCCYPCMRADSLKAAADIILGNGA